MSCAARGRAVEKPSDLAPALAGLAFAAIEGEKMIRVLLVGDHAKTHSALRKVLAADPELEIVGEVLAGRMARAQTVALKPDVVVLDVPLPDHGGADAARGIVDALPGVKVVALTKHAGRRYVEVMLGAGAAGYVLTHAAARELVDAIRIVTSHDRRYVSPAARGGRASALSPRERQVLHLLADGKTSKEIGTELGIAIPTVETHRRQIATKLGIHSIAGLTKFAVREGLTRLEA